MKKGLSLLMVLLLTMTMLLIGCHLNEDWGSEQGRVHFPELTAEETFGDEPYHLFFQSNGDGTCEIKAITMNPQNDQGFYLEFPDESPAGDAVTAINIFISSSGRDNAENNLPTIIPEEDFNLLCTEMRENGISDFYYKKITAFYIATWSETTNQEEKTRAIDAYPIAEYERVYVLDPWAFEFERNSLYSYLQTYCDEIDEKVKLYNEKVLELAKCCETMERAELYLASLRYQNAELITGVTIPDSVTALSKDFFKTLSNLTSVKIGNGITDIPKHTFSGHLFSGYQKLTSVELGNSTTSIGDGAFSGCTGLTSITIPDSVKSIGSEAFSGCTGLTSITIPNSVTYIDSHAFQGCAGLTSITIPDSVTSIGELAFGHCTALMSITVAEGNKTYYSENNCIIEKKTDTLVAGCQSSVIPESVISIGCSAFSGHTDLTSITIPDSVESIEDYAFNGCIGLTSITIPDSVTSIGYGAFLGCTGLTSITIPDSVTSIGSYAFSQCYGLESITIPDSVTSIGSEAFSGCTGLTSITIPNSVTSIGGLAFCDCTGLTDIYYTGTEEEWAAIEIEGGLGLEPATTIHYNYVPEE